MAQPDEPATNRPTPVVPLRTMPSRACYFAAECAERLGMSLRTFERQRAELHRRGMPPSATHGRLRIPKKLFDAWLEHRKPLPAGANDAAPVAPDAVDWRGELAREYGA